MSARLRVQNFMVTRDGIGAAEDQSLEKPFGSVDTDRLHAWLLATASFPGRTDGGGSRGLDDRIVADFSHGIGAEIMGRNKFGPQRGPWSDHEWIGWWGEEPPFRTPVVVLTHHPRPTLTLGETSFHFLDAPPAEALRVATDLAGGADVRLGGGVRTVRDFLAADLVDDLHVAVAPFEADHGLRLWRSPQDLEATFAHESVLSPSGVEHHFYWRDPASRSGLHGSTGGSGDSGPATRRR